MADKKKKIGENGGDKAKDENREQNTGEDMTTEETKRDAAAGKKSTEECDTEKMKKTEEDQDAGGRTETGNPCEPGSDTEGEKTINVGEKAQSEESPNSGKTTQEEESAEAKYMRLMADFRNFKKRAEKEKLDIYAYANEKIVVGLLDVLDNFERALEHESADPAYAEGMKMIFKQLMAVLKDSGLEEIKTQGESFDPNFHNAVMTEDNPEFESGKVTEVLQKGYSLNNKVIRPSMVKVNN